MDMDTSAGLFYFAARRDICGLAGLAEAPRRELLGGPAKSVAEKRFIEYLHNDF
jgi:hypothetical protein